MASNSPVAGDGKREGVSSMNAPQLSNRLLIVEDEPAIRLVLEDTLRPIGYEVLSCDSAEIALTLLDQMTFRILVTDLMLPRMNGEELIARVREQDKEIGIIVMSCKSDQSSHDHLFRLGADHYLDKPFSPRELVNHVRALERRLPLGATERLQIGHLKLCFQTQRAWIDDEPIKLTAMEFQLLEFLAASGGKPISRYDLLEEVWGMDSETTPRSVDAFISTLRKKIECGGKSGKIIEAVRGIGYRFNAEPI